MYAYFKDLEAGVERAIVQNPQQPNARKKYVREIARIGSRLYACRERVAWCGITAPFDLLSALGVTSCFVEFIGAVMASAGVVEPFLETAEQAGFAPDICGFHRAVIGAARSGAMPVPAFLIATTCPCSGGLSVMENLARIFKKDLFVLNIPQEDTPESVAYLADQLRGMVDFVVAHTGEALEKERLADAIANTNRARQMMDDVFRLARHVPSPTSGRDLSNLGFVFALLLGSRAGVEIARAYRDEFAARVASHSGGMPGERLRLLWIQNRIQFKNPLESMLKELFQANIVVDELNDITWDPIDPEDPYPGIARRAISNPLNGNIMRRIAHVRQQARDYHVDGAVNPCHWGCRQGAGARGLMAEGLREIGVPVLNLEVDTIDARNFSKGQLRTRLQAFVEMLENQPKRLG